MDQEMTFTRGALVAFEGMDKAGKSTQMQAFKDTKWRGAEPQFVHMPSGLTQATHRIYAALEGGGLESALGKQLFHLACHAENVSAIAEARSSGAVVLDRFWWSTVAYGWYGGRLAETGLDEPSFMSVITTIWGSLTPDIVFLFLDPHRHDANNINGVEVGYRALAHQFPEQTVLVPKLSVQATTSFIIENLESHGLVHRMRPADSGASLPVEQ